MSPRYRWLTILLAAGCTRATPATAPSPEPQPVPQTPGAPRIVDVGRAWRFTRTSEPHTYISTGTTTIELSSDPSLPSDTLVHTLRFNLTIIPNPPASTLNGSIEAFSIRAGKKFGAADRPLDIPLLFTGETSNATATLRPAGTTSTSLPDCTTPAFTAFAAVQRNVIVPPLEVTAGMQWADSSSLNTCSGPILTTTTTTHTYTVLGETRYEGSASVVIDRVDRIVSTGEGSEGQHRILVTTEGTGSGKLYLNPNTGMLMGAEGQYRTALTVTASGRTQRFTQNVFERTSVAR